MFKKNVFPEPFKDRFPKTVQVLPDYVALRWSIMISAVLFARQPCFHTYVLSVVNVHVYVWFQVTYCVCVCIRQLCWSLPPISLTSVHPSTWVFFYVHCGFSTCPALRSQPQIRAVYLTAVASSISYKNTPVPSLPPSSCISYFLSSLSINAAAPNVLHRAVSCRLALLFFFLRWKKMKKCTHKQPWKLEETNTCMERERCMSGMLLYNTTLLSDMGKFSHAKRSKHITPFNELMIDSLLLPCNFPH